MCVLATLIRQHKLDNGRPGLFPPCDSHINVKEKFGIKNIPTAISPQLNVSALATESCLEKLGETAFCRTDRDNQLAPSVEDMMFLQKMEESFKENTNSWVAPLPFCVPIRLLPSNRDYAFRRFLSQAHVGQERRHESSISRVYAEAAA